MEMFPATVGPHHVIQSNDRLRPPTAMKIKPCEDSIPFPHVPCPPSPLVLYIIYPPSVSKSPEAPAEARAKLQAMGPGGGWVEAHPKTGPKRTCTCRAIKTLPLASKQDSEICSLTHLSNHANIHAIVDVITEFTEETK